MVGIITMQETAAVTICAGTGLLKVMALATRRWLDGLTFAVLVLALLTIAAAAGVTESSADLFRHCSNCSGDNVN